MTTPKYEYALYTWGGFYNDHNVAIHGFKPEKSQIYFDTKENRTEYLNLLENAKKLVTNLGSTDAYLATDLSEGYTVRDTPVMHRIVKYKNKEYYSSNKWSWHEDDISVLQYHMTYKWYPGFNDDIIEQSLNEEIDYNKVEIVQEWITGSFKNDYEY